MVATACEWVLDRQIIIPLLISTEDTSNKDQALVIDFRKKDMMNNINVIVIILMLELLEWSPAIPGFGFKQFAERVLRKESCRKSLQKESGWLRIE